MIGLDNGGKSLGYSIKAVNPMTEEGNNLPTGLVEGMSSYSYERVKTWGY